jgi:hypothetical protein
MAAASSLFLVTLLAAPPRWLIQTRDGLDFRTSPTQPAVVLTGPVQMTCPEGHQSTVEAPLIVRAGQHGSDPRRVRCDACGATVLLDKPLLILDRAPIGLG